MELNQLAIDTPPLPAATLILSRDGPDGAEVLLMRRHSASEVLGGAFVFPGGKLDAADAAVDAAAHLDQSPEQLHASLHDAELDAAVAAGLYVAAVREAFEEAGVLLADAPGGATPDLARAAALLKAGVPFNAMLARLGLRLQTRQLAPWSRWITPRVPSVMRKRFDTRFFVAAAPRAQIAQHDAYETIESRWTTPRAALAAYWERAIDLAPPQVMTLAHLARYDSAAAIVAAARAAHPPLICSERLESEGMRVVCYPGDPEHSQAERLLPGPTRLRWNEGRFEPVGGFEAFFR